MDTQVTKKTYQEMSKSIILVKQIKRELTQSGKTTIVCPKCGKSPEIMTTSNGERTIIKCDCKYIYDVEINF